MNLRYNDQQICRIMLIRNHCDCFNIIKNQRHTTMWRSTKLWRNNGYVGVVAVLSSTQPSGTMVKTINVAAPFSKRQFLFDIHWYRIAMEFFRKLLSAMGISTSSNKYVDFISDLPVEVAQHLLRMLDAPSLLNASVVSRRWLSLCKGDNYVRQSVLHQIRKQKREIIQIADISRKINKSLHNRTEKTKQKSLCTRRTDIAPIHFRNIKTFKSTHNMYRIDASMKLSRNSSKSRIATSVTKLRIM